MRISKYRIERIKALIQDIHELDKLIALHRQHTSDDFMTSQYEAKKHKYFQRLVQHLLHPSFNADGFNTYQLVQRLIERFYGAQKRNPASGGEPWRSLESVVMEAAA